ncbi:MAG: hypothetical protein ACR2O4_06875 [Hyphomicrobiaceae bacterium]
MTFLHITNGDGAANIIKASSVDGDVLPWRDTMHHGPFPPDLDLDAVSDVRAEFFSGPGLSDEDIYRDFRLRNDHLRAAARYDEVVLWFEHDLLDQLQILQLLDWFLDTDIGATKLSMICINQFTGVEPFRGIGQLDCEQMASLLDVRETVTEDQMRLARSGWRAYRSTTPTDLEAFLETELTPLPFLRSALARHLEEYPSSTAGLTRTEQQILRLVCEGVSAPGRIFADNMDFETALFLGDWGTFSRIANFGDARALLIRRTDGQSFLAPPHDRVSAEAFRAQRLEPTEQGQEIFSGQRDAWDCIDRDEWLGGVHLKTGRPIWTWDANAGQLALRDNC